MKSVIALLNKFCHPRRQIHHFNDIQDGVLFAQLEDELYYISSNYNSFQTNFKKIVWNHIFDNLQRIRRNNNLQIKEFDEEISFFDSNEELTKFIKYFLETIFHVKKEEAIYYMKQCLDHQQEEIAQFIQSDYQDIVCLSDQAQMEFQTTSTIISLEETLYSKDNIIIQQYKQIEQMKSDYLSIFQELQNKNVEQEEMIERLHNEIIFFLNKILCNDFEEAWVKFSEFAQDLERNKLQIEELNILIEKQQKEISKKRRKNQNLKSQLSSNQPTERALEYDPIDQRDSHEARTAEILKKDISTLKEENLKLLSKSSQYEQEINKYRKKLYEYEQEKTSYKKKMEKYKHDLDEFLSQNQFDKKNYLDNLRPQGLLSSNNSQIIESEQRLGVSPKSNCFEFNQSLNKFDHPVSFINQSFKNSDENNIAKLQLQITEKNNKIASLERQINLMHHGTHSRGNSLTKFNQNQQERHVDQANLYENLHYYVQYSKMKEREVQNIKEQQNENFFEICRQLIKQNEQIQKFNSLIFELQNEEQIKENTHNQSVDIQNEQQFYLQALNNKDELLQLITSIFYENVKI